MAEMTDLELIFSTEAKIASLEPLSGMAKLERLNLSIDRVDTGLAGLEGLTNMKEAQLYLNFSEDAPDVSLEALAGWKKLMSLMLQANIGGQDLTPLAGLTELRSLDFHTNTHEPPIQSLEPLRGLTNLQNLSISHVRNGIDLSPVEHVSSVEIW